MKYWPIIRRDTVRCSLPEAFIAPRTVPTTAQQIPTKAIMTMNQRMLTVCDTDTPQHDLVSDGWTGWTWGSWPLWPPPGNTVCPAAPHSASLFPVLQQRNIFSFDNKQQIRMAWINARVELKKFYNQPGNLDNQGTQACEYWWITVDWAKHKHEHRLAQDPIMPGDPCCADEGSY